MEDLKVFNSLMDYTQVNIKGCGDVIHDNVWSESGHKLDYDIWIMLEGELELYIEERRFIIKPKDCVFLYPQIFYKANSISGSCNFIYIHFDYKIGDNIRALDDFSLEGLVSQDELKVEIELFIKSYFAYKRREPLSFLSLNGYFTALLSKIIVQQYEKNKLLNRKNAAITKPLSRIQPVLSYISEHLSGPIYTKELGKILGLSEKYFITFFKETIGTAPGKYISQAKMNMALNYVYEGNYSLKEISYLLGYSDQYTFSKAFKKHYGLAPSKIKN